MIQRVVILVNTNLYETKRNYAVGLCDALRKRGISCTIVGTRGASLDTPDIEAIQKLAPDFTCSFNTISSLSTGLFLWDYTRIPHWTINLDPVVYVLNLRKSRYSIISCVDELDCEMVKESGFENVFFFPHATESSLVPSDGERPLDVVMIGSCYDHEGLRETWPARFSPELCNAMDESVEKVLSDNCTPFMEAVQQSLHSHQIHPGEIDLSSVVFNVDYYLRGLDRFELLRAMQGVKVHIIGGLHTQTAFGVEGWKRYLKRLPGVTVQSPIPFGETLKVLQKFKISLNSVPSFKKGTHVRVFSSLASGCLPLTSDNLYWREHFKDGEDILLYQHKRWNEAGERVRKILQDNKSREKIVSHGRAKVMKEHTWESRVDTILKEMPPILERIHSDS